MKMGDPATILRYGTQLAKKEHTRNLSLDRMERVLERVRSLNLTDAFASTTFRCLDHDREADLLRPRQALLHSRHARGAVDVVGDRHKAFRGELRLSDASSRPGHGWYIRALRDNGTGDLVTETAHRAARGTDEDDLVRGEGFG